MNHPKYILFFIQIALTILISPVSIFAQQEQNSVAKDTVSAVVEEKKVEVFSAVREELHRYIGYEELLAKYISLPYDVTMDTNIGGAFVDISYLFLIFLPILFLLGIKDVRLKLVTIVLMILFLIISIPTAYRSSYIIKNEDIGRTLDAELSETSFAGNPIIFLKLKITQAVNALYQPIHNGIIANFSGEGDSITYPILLALFVLLFFLLKDRLKNKSELVKNIGLFLLMYGFLWLILSSGVLWYGLILFPIGLLCIGGIALKNTTTTSFPKYLFLALSIFWLASAISYRFSNYALPLTEEDFKNGASQEIVNASAIHAASFLYGTGRLDKSGITDFLFPAYASIVNRINKEPEALVYRVGTYFQYFITNNHERVLEDNQLAYFDLLQGLVESKEEAAVVLQGQGYRYLIVDLNVATIDRTPDASLINKAKKFQEFLRNNSRLEVIGTDRLVVNENGMQVFGLRGRKIIDNGSFIAFRIK